MKSLQILFWLLVLCIHCVMAQEKSVPQVNQLNEKGNREGLWIEENEIFRNFTYYLDGKKNGPCYGIDKRTNSPSRVGEFKNGVYNGVWHYFFYEDGVFFTSVLKDFKKCEHPETNYVYQCYAITYYPNGNKAEEGIWLFVDDPLNDCTSEYGKWKYYNEDGSLKEIKEEKVHELLKVSDSSQE